jgi:hypothetical protein
MYKSSLFWVVFLLLFFFIGIWIRAELERKNHVCKPVKLIHETKTFTKYDTIIIVDTLVIIERTTLKPYPAQRINYISSWSLETQPYELFKNGKTRDTILREVWEHY